MVDGHKPLMPVEADYLREMREGYQPTTHPLPDVTVEFIEDQNMGRTPLDDLKDGDTYS